MTDISFLAIKGLSVEQQIVLLFFIVLWVVRFVYLLLFPMRMLFRKKGRKKSGRANPVSFIFSLRNEEGNARNVLPSLLDMESANVEVIAVDDFSQDNTLSVLGGLKQRYGSLKISLLSQENRFSEKISRNLALKSATSENVMFLPASACSISKPWLGCFTESMGDKYVVKVGYSTISPVAGFFNNLFRIETFFQFLRSASCTKNGAAFIYNEENVLFKKNKYFENGGFARKLNEPYANLELVINRFIRSGSTSLLINREAVLVKNESVNGADFFNLLRKSIRIEKHLGLGKRFFLSLNCFFEFFYRIAVLITLLFVFEFWSVIAVFASVNFILYAVIVKMLQNRLNERKIFITSVIYSFVMPFYKLFFRWHFKKNTRKNRWRSNV